MQRLARLVIPLAFLLVIIGLVVVYLITQGQGDDESLPPLTETYTSPTAFNFKYPEGWTIAIPAMNVLILSQNETLTDAPGPTFTIQRSVQFSRAESLEEALETYLQRGPLQEDHLWETTTEITPISFNDREALMIELEGRDQADFPPSYLKIITTKAERGPVYFFVMTIPLNEHETIAPLFDSILQSIEIVE